MPCWYAVGLCHIIHLLTSAMLHGARPDDEKRADRLTGGGMVLYMAVRSLDWPQRTHATVVCTRAPAI